MTSKSSRSTFEARAGDEDAQPDDARSDVSAPVVSLTWSKLFKRIGDLDNDVVTVDLDVIPFDDDGDIGGKPPLRAGDDLTFLVSQNGSGDDLSLSLSNHKTNS